MDEVHARLAAESGPPGEPVQLDPGTADQLAGLENVSNYSKIKLLQLLAKFFGFFFSI